MSCLQLLRFANSCSKVAAIVHGISLHVNFLQSTVTVHMLPHFITKEKLLEHRMIAAVSAARPSAQATSDACCTTRAADTAAAAAAAECHT